MPIWVQPLNPLNSMALSALVAVVLRAETGVAANVNLPRQVPHDSAQPLLGGASSDNTPLQDLVNQAQGEDYVILNRNPAEVLLRVSQRLPAN